MRRNPTARVVAYSRQCAVIEGAAIGALSSRTRTDMCRYQRGADPHPDEGRNAQSPDGDFAVSRRGDRLGWRDSRRRRDRARGGKPKAGLAGFSVSNLRDSRRSSSRGKKDYGKARSRSPRRSTSCSKGPIGAAAFNNEFGRPNLAGYFRTFEQEVQGESARLSQADHGRRRAGQHRGAAIGQDQGFCAGTLLIQLGGPGMLIGLGGGAASAWRLAAIPTTSISPRCSAAIRKCSAAARK